MPRVPDVPAIALFFEKLSRTRKAADYILDNGQVERMNRTIKKAIVKRCRYDRHQQLENHLADFGNAYKYARRLESLKGLTPYEFIIKAWTKEPEQFKFNPIRQMPGLNT